MDFAQQQCRNFWYDRYLTCIQPFSLQTFSKIPLGTLNFTHTPSICFPKPNEAEIYVENFSRLVMAAKIDLSQNPDSLKYVAFRGHTITSVKRIQYLLCSKPQDVLNFALFFGGGPISY